MNLLKVVFFVMLFSSCVAKSAKQVPYTKHTVEKGETVYSLAKKYQITPFDIYRLNPDAKNGIQENTVLLIPKKNTSVVTDVKDNSDVTTHLVKTKETLFSLAKQYEVSVSDLKEWNPEVEKEGLKIGQEIIVSKNYKPENSGYVEEKVVNNTTSVFSHVVKTQETVYGISKKYNISIAELEELNPQIKTDGLKIGDVLTLKRNNEIAITKVNNEENLYTVKPKETLFSLSKQFNVSPSELIALNPELKEGLREGMQLKLPSSIVFRDSPITRKPIVRLIDLVDFTTQKELVLLLPFNLSKVQSDSTKTRKDYIKNDKFLNLTLDFYSGALMAIDSAKVLGLPVTVKILNVESSRSSSNIARIISSNDFSNVNAVIGPFYNSHTEATAEYLSKYNTPVISPLSKEKSKALPNLYNAVPTQKRLYTALFDYMNLKNGNIVAIISQKKNSTSEYLKAHYPSVKHVSYNEKGIATLENIKSQLVLGQKNFVILDSERANQVMNITNSLMKLKNEFDIQLVVLELYDTLDYEEIPITNLTELKMLFPSTRKEFDSPESLLFDKEYRKTYGATPNSRVVSGFDTTFDALLRICQKEGFKASNEIYNSEYVENGFDYVDEDGVLINNAVYIQYYDTDYSIKQAQ